jgi:membrane associated rhomboid family serine protease
MMARDVLIIFDFFIIAVSFQNLLFAPIGSVSVGMHVCAAVFGSVIFIAHADVWHRRRRVKKENVPVEGL